MDTLAYKKTVDLLESFQIKIEKRRQEPCMGKILCY